MSRIVKVVRILTYEGPEDAMLAGLSYRAVRGFRVLGSGITCHESFCADDDIQIATDHLSQETVRMRAAIDRLNVPVIRRRDANGTGYERDWETPNV